MIVGGPGSGKSTLAVRLGEVTGLPVFHLDKLQYLPGWVVRPTSEISSMTREIHSKDQWVFEGLHSVTYSERAARADLFIWLDLPVLTRLYRVLRRSCIYHGRTRPDMHEGCPQQINWQTIEFLCFIIRTRKSEREEIFEIYKNPPDNLRVIRLTDQAEIDNFFVNLESAI